MVFMESCSLCSHEFRGWEVGIYSLCMCSYHVQHGTGDEPIWGDSGMKKWQTVKTHGHKNVGIRWTRLSRETLEVQSVYYIESNWVTYSRTRRWSYYTEINKEAGFVVHSWIKGTTLAYLNRGAIFLPSISGGNFLHILSKLALGRLRKTTLSPWAWGYGGFLDPHILLQPRVYE